LAPEDKIKTGILLLNLGGPDSLRSVRPFLFNLFSDREIIRLGPSFMQKPLAFLISTLRSKKTESFYKMIGGKSPIFDMTLAQAKALEEELNKLGDRSEEIGEKEASPVVSYPLPLTPYPLHFFRVFLAMRYWHPLIEDVIPEIYKSGIKRLIVLSLYPQYSVATTGSTLSKLTEVISKCPIEIFSIKSWHNHPLYIDALVEKIKEGINSFNKDFISKESFPLVGNPSEERLRTSRSDKLDSHISHLSLITHHSSPEKVHVLFSAHSLPAKFIEEGDPYVDQIKETINEVTKKINIQWSLSYQSKSGPVKWLGPSTEQMLHELAGRGIKDLLVVPISFVSDHVETLYEIDILYKNMADKLGIKLQRTESLNTSPLFISALRNIVIKAMKETGWQE